MLTTSDRLVPIGTMPASTAAAISALQVIPLREDDVPLGCEVVVLRFQSRRFHTVVLRFFVMVHERNTKVSYRPVDQRSAVQSLVDRLWITHGQPNSFGPSRRPPFDDHEDRSFVDGRVVGCY